jgi:hypothetical protein
MARSFATALASLVRHDGAWLRCRNGGCDAYWGDFRPTAFVVAKAQAHQAKVHGVQPARLQAGRPQRRAAQAAPDLLALVTAFVDAHVGGAARLGRGISREVFPFGPDHVVKIAHNPSEGHNLAEAKAWNDAPDWARPHLAPVVAVDPAGRWLLMRKCDRIGAAQWADAKVVASALRDRVGDLHEGNIGWLSGRWVALDYAGGWNAVSVAW